MAAPTVRYIAGHGFRHTLTFRDFDGTYTSPTGFSINIFLDDERVAPEDTLDETDCVEESDGIWTFTHIPAEAGTYLFVVLSEDAIPWSFQYTYEVSAGY